MNKIWRAGREIWSHLSVRAGAYALVAITGPVWAVLFGRFVPPSMLTWSSGPALEKMLGIVTSNMLTIVTFSLSTLVATLALILSSAPPRATALIVRDARAHRALATFLGAFLFSVSAVVSLSAGAFSPGDQLILSLMTFATLMAVVWTIVRWIGHLSGMGQLNNMIDRIEKMSETTIRDKAFLLTDDLFEHTPAPPTEYEFCAVECGFIQHIDYAHLGRLATEHDTRLAVHVTAGMYVQPGMRLASTARARSEDDLMSSVQSAFVLGARRSFADDARFGFIVLSEIGSRALSPGINDPGTAIQVLASLFRLVNALPPASHSRADGPLELRRISTRAIFDDAFRSIARDGAAMVEVQIFLQKGLVHLARQSRFAQSAAALSAEAMAYSNLKLELSAERDRVARAAGSI